MPTDEECYESTSSEPTLPPLRRSVMSFAPRSRKRHLEIDPADSSDPPMFSSDDILCSSTEDYQNGRRKRQYKGTWWGEEARGSADEDLVARPKREFKRDLDSGVWMGSDGSIM